MTEDEGLELERLAVEVRQLREELEQKSLEAASLSRTAASLREVLSSAPSFVVTMDPDATIRFVNVSIIPGRTAEDLVGVCLYDLLPEEKRARTRTAIERVATSGMPDAFEEVSHRLGRPTAYNVRIGPLRHGDVISGISMIATDVTEVRELQSRLALADRLSSVGALAAGVAHEINNPLTYVLMSLRSVAKALAGDDLDRAAVTSQLELALQGTEHIRAIVAELGTLSRSGDEATGPVDIQSVLELAIKMATNELRFRARVARDYGDVPAVLGNASRLSQVCLNLLVNAAQAIDEGDVDNNEVRITTRSTAEGHVMVAIRDTGHGIGPELLPHVFEPFVTSKEVGRGSGLGLHICHRLVTAMHGTIAVESEPGKGSVFTLLLPSTPEATPLVAVEPPAQAFERSARVLKILVADDEPGVRAALRTMLRDHEVTLVASGREALAELSRQRYDFVLCDLMMPDQTGMDVFAHLERENPKQLEAVVFMTGGAFTPAAAAFVAEVPNVVLNKPFDSEQLEELLQLRARSD